MLSVRFDHALVFASNLHRDQVRKGTNIPYISHLLSVAALVIEHGGTEDQAIAALLHDAAEDQGGEEILTQIERNYGPLVAEIVSDCTDAWVEPKPDWWTRKRAYLAGLPKKPMHSQLVSLADKVHNAKAISADLAQIGERLWDRFNAKREGTLWYYGALSDHFSAHVPGRLSDELRAHVSAFSGT